MERFLCLLSLGDVYECVDRRCNGPIRRELRYYVSHRPENFVGFRVTPPGIQRSSLDDGKRDRKSTRLNSSHQIISYAVFCLKKKKKNICTSTSNSHRM